MKKVNESIIKEVKEKLKKGKVILGYRKSLKYLKLNKPKFVIVAENAPEEIKKDIFFVLTDKNKLKVFKGTSIELGTLCGKPFPVSVLVVKE